MTFEAAIDDLIQHMEWADALVWTTVMASPAAASNDAIRDRLHHLHHTQHACDEALLSDKCSSELL